MQLGLSRFERWWESEKDKREFIKKKRFGKGCFLGRITGQGIRFVTLSHFKTLNGKNTWTNFIKLLRKEFGKIEYAKVIHTKGANQHIHFVYRGSFIPVRDLSQIWFRCSSFKVVWIEKVWGDEHKLYAYMANVEDNDKVRWDYSRKWCPNLEQAYLEEVCLLSMVVS